MVSNITHHLSQWFRAMGNYFIDYKWCIFVHLSMPVKYRDRQNNSLLFQEMAINACVLFLQRLHALRFYLLMYSKMFAGRSIECGETLSCLIFLFSSLCAPGARLLCGDEVGVHQLGWLFLLIISSALKLLWSQLTLSITGISKLEPNNLLIQLDCKKLPTGNNGNRNNQFQVQSSNIFNWCRVNVAL